MEDTDSTVTKSIQNASLLRNSRKVFYNHTFCVRWGEGSYLPHGEDGRAPLQAVCGESEQQHHVP